MIYCLSARKPKSRASFRILEFGHVKTVSAYPGLDILLILK